MLRQFEVVAATSFRQYYGTPDLLLMLTLTRFSVSVFHLCERFTLFEQLVKLPKLRVLSLLDCTNVQPELLASFVRRSESLCSLAIGGTSYERIVFFVSVYISRSLCAWNGTGDSSRTGSQRLAMPPAQPEPCRYVLPNSLSCFVSAAFVDVFSL